MVLGCGGAQPPRPTGGGSSTDAPTASTGDIGSATEAPTGGAETTSVDDSGGAACGNGVVEEGEACDDMGESATCNADCTTAMCGDGQVNAAAGETCDGPDGPTAECDSDCTAASCGDGVINELAGELCDDGRETETCDADCTPAECGDGVHNMHAFEACDDGRETETCDVNCTTAFCGDGTVNMTAGETCDERRETATCDLDCTAASCGDGVVNSLAAEDCDDMGESFLCDADCSLAECGDGQVNATAAEDCDDQGESAACDLDCTVAVCGDGTLNPSAAEQCDDGNAVADDGCTGCMFDFGTCAAPAVLLSTSPTGTMMLCDDPTDSTCEEDMETLCPPGWGLCTRLQHINRNAGWNVPTGGFGSPEVAVGEIYCRGGGQSGQYTLGPYDGVTSLEDDPPLNCGYGSSRPSCPGNFGCTEQEVRTLCCAPTPSCGNGIVDSVEEECDDGNLDEFDACLNSCSWRVPSAQGVPGAGC